MTTYRPPVGHSLAINAFDWIANTIKAPLHAILTVLMVKKSQLICIHKRGDQVNVLANQISEKKWREIFLRINTSPCFRHGKIKLSHWLMLLTGARLLLYIYLALLHHKNSQDGMERRFKSYFIKTNKPVCFHR